MTFFNRPLFLHVNNQSIWNGKSSSIKKKGFLLIFGLFLGGLAIKFEFLSIPIIIGMMASIIILVNVEIGLYVFLFITQFLIIFYISKEISILLFVSWLLYVFRNKPDFFPSMQSKLLLTLSIWAVFFQVIFSSKSFYLFFMDISKLLVAIMLYFVITTVIKSQEQLMRFIKSVLIIGACLSTIGIIQLLFQVPVLPTVRVDPNSIILASGSTGDPVAYGTRVTFILMLCFSMLLGQSAGSYKRFLLILLLGLIFSLLASLNRSALLGLSMFGIVILLLNRKAGVRLFIFLVIGLFFLSLSPIIDIFINQISSIWITVSTQSGHFGARLDSVIAALEVIKANPIILIIGGGINSYGMLTLPFVQTTTAVLGHVNACSPVVFALELGIPGFVLVLSIICLTLREFFLLQKDFKKEENHKMCYLTQGLFASLLALLVISLANAIWFMQFFWINIAFSVVIKNISTNSKKEKKEIEQPPSESKYLQPILNID